MKKDEFISNCIYCGKKPHIIHYDTDMWYVECGNKECHKHLKYSYLGFRREIAIDQWNYANRPMNRTPPPKKKKQSKG